MKARRPEQVARPQEAAVVGLDLEAAVELEPTRQGLHLLALAHREPGEEADDLVRERDVARGDGLLVP